MVKRSLLLNMDQIFWLLGLNWIEINIPQLD